MALSRKYFTFSTFRMHYIFEKSKDRLNSFLFAALVHFILKMEGTIEQSFSLDSLFLPMIPDKSCWSYYKSAQI